jgi:hypothetical protein
MAKLEDEEEQHLATLHDLEATREEIASYQGLLKDLPEIYERKFNERLKPLLDRQQHLIDERAQLLHQLRQSLPSSRAEEIRQLPPVAAPQDGTAKDGPSPHSHRRRPWWLVGMAGLGLTLGWHLSRVQPRSDGRPEPSLPPAISPAPADPAATPRRESASQAEATTVRGRAVARAMAEWAVFERPLLKQGRLVRAGRNEADPGQWQRVITYWREGLFSDSVRNQADVSSRDHPWSAAFIAYVMRQAGAGDHFPYRASHSGSIKEAIHNRQHSVRNARLIGHPVLEYAPRPGDLLCTTRAWATGKVTYANADQFDFFPSRCELVVRVSSGQIDAIGGDLREAVTLHTIPAVNGKIAEAVAQDWLVVIQTELD